MIHMYGKSLHHCSLTQLLVCHVSNCRVLPSFGLRARPGDKAAAARVTLEALGGQAGKQGFSTVYGP